MALRHLVWGLRHLRLVSRLLIRYWAGCRLAREGYIPKTFRMFRAQPDETVQYFAHLAGPFSGIARKAGEELALRQRQNH